MRSQDWDQYYAGAELVWGVGPSRFLAAEVDGLPADRALDLGCGEGRNAIWLAERAWQLTGVDFSQVGLDKARRLAAERGVEIRLVHADLLDFTPADIERELAGLLIERVERVRRPFAVDGREVDAIDALVRAKRPVDGPAGTSVGPEPLPEAT